MHLLESIWRIDDLRHCGVYRLVKQNVFTHWGLAQAFLDDFFNWRKSSMVLELSWVGCETFEFI